MKFTRFRVAALAVVLAACLALPLGAQTAAPFALGDLFTEAPDVTVGFEGEYGSAVSSNPATTWDDAFDTIVYDPMSKRGTAFATAPWIGLQWGGLQMTTRFSYDLGEAADVHPDLGGDNAWGSDYIIESIFAMDLGPLSVTERIIYDPNAPNYFEDFGAVFEAGKISAGFRTYALYDAATPFLFFNGSFAGHEIADAWMAAEDLGGLVDLKVGGIDARYLRLRSLFFDEDPTAMFSEIMPILLKPVFASQNRTRGLLRVVATAAMGGMGPEIMSAARTAISASQSFDGLTLYQAMAVPFAGTAVKEWLQTNNMLIGARYAIEGLGTFDAGWDVGLGYKQAYYFDGVATYYKDYKVGNLGDNRFWLDADLDLVDGLELLAGFDMRLFGFRNLDGDAGGGTVGDPIAQAYETAFAANVGVEARYGLDSLAAGLSVEGGLYLAFWGGKTWDMVNAGAQTFAQYLDATLAPVATRYRMDSLTEGKVLNNPIGAGASQYDGAAPLVAYLAGDWRLDEAWGFKLANQFQLDARELTGANFFAGAPNNPPVGYYSVDAVELEARYTEGKAVFSLGFGWEFAIGLPSVADLGYVDGTAGYATAKDAYRAQGPYGTAGAATSPWTLTAGVTLEF